MLGTGTAFIVGAAVALTMVLIVFFIWLGKTAPERGGARSVFADLLPIGLVMLGLLVASALLTFGLYIAQDDKAAFSDAIWQGATASLIEDIIFFSIGGVVVFALQKADFYRSRRLEDRIDYLFNAKYLTSEERSYLKREIATFACDYWDDRTTVDIVEHDEEHNMVKLDVTRIFRVGNYLKEQSAIYTLLSTLTPDPMPDSRCPMEIFPISYRIMTISGDGEPEPIGTHQKLRDFTQLKTSNEKFDFKSNPIDIPPGQIVECSLRWRGWQSLQAPAQKDGETGNDSHDVYEMTFRKHWDVVVLGLRNSLETSIKVTIESPHGTDVFPLRRGFASDREWRGLDVKPGTQVKVRFTKN